MSDTLDCLNTLINDVVRDAQNYGISYAEAYFNRVNDLLTDNGDTRDLVFAGGACGVWKFKSTITFRQVHIVRSIQQKPPGL